MFHRSGLVTLVASAFLACGGNCLPDSSGSTNLLIAGTVIMGEPEIAGVYDEEDRVCSPAPCVDEDGERIFAFAYDEERFEQLGGTRELALSYHERGLTGAQMGALLSLGVDPSEYGRFVDTGRPNFLLTLPYDEGTKLVSGEVAARRHFYNNLDMLLDVFEHYDVAIVFTRDEDDLCEVSNKRSYDAGLISGHGRAHLLELSADAIDLSYDARHLSVGDLEEGYSKRCFRGFGSDSTIVLWSCSNGDGGQGARNIANAVHDATCSRVYASLTNFNVNATNFVSFFPLDVEFYNSRAPFEDSTYVLAACD